MKLFPKLALLLSVVALVPIAVFALLGISRANDALNERIASEQTRRAEAAADQASSDVRAVLHSLSLYAGYADFGAARGEVLTGVLRVAYRQSDDIAVISLIDERGIEIIPSVYLENPSETDALRNHPGVSADDLELYSQNIPLEAALASGAAIGPLHGERGHPRVVLAVETPHRREGQRLVLVAQMGLESLLASLRIQTHPGRAEVLLVDREGRPIDDLDATIAIPGRLEGRLPEESITGPTEHEGIRYLTAYSPVPLLGWGALVRQREAAALAPISRLRRHSTYWAFVGVLLAIILAALVARDLSLRIGDLVDHSGALARGDLAKRVPVRGKDEIGNLATSFNKMAQDLETRRAEIEKRNHEIKEWNEKLEQRVAEKTDELARAQEIVLRSRRLAGLGVLGAGVAHEINNPLASTLGYVQLVLVDKELDKAHRESLEQASSSALRIREIVQDLLKLTEDETRPSRTTVNLAHVVQRATQLARSALEEKKVQLSLDIPEDLPQIPGNAGQLTEVLLHLVRNALNALERNGEISIEGRHVGGQLLTLVVEDNGKGIPPDLIDRVFDPFFTTKDDWEGRGLGLSVVHKIVEDHGGRLDLSSELGSGTKVTITLPTSSLIEHLD